VEKKELRDRIYDIDRSLCRLLSDIEGQSEFDDAYELLCDASSSLNPEAIKAVGD